MTETPFNLGQMMAGGKSGDRAKSSKLWRTPAEATLGLVQADVLPTGAPIWEPAAGEGDIVRVLEDCGFAVVASELVPGRSPANICLDFLQAKAVPQGGRFERPNVIVMNPPFDLAREFIAKALSFPNVFIVASLLKIQFWNVANNLMTWERHTPAIWMPITWRLDFDGRGQPPMDCAWGVWIKGVRRCELRPMPKPRGQGNGRLFEGDLA